MKKRAVAILMSLALAIGNMIPMPVYAAQETTEESAEEITVEEESGGTEAKDESEEAEEADGRAEAVVSEEESAPEGTDESESAADTDGEAVTEADEEEEGETAEESAAEDEEGAVNGSSLADKTQSQEEELVTEEIITDEEGTEAAADYIDEYTGPAQYKINMDGVDESGYIYADYLNIVNECIIQYGGTEELNGPSSGMKHFTGLSFLKLVDFNDDGVEELFLAFHVRTNAETDNYENHVYIYNIWGFDGQRAVLLQDGNYLYGLNGGAQKVYFVNNPFGTFFLHGVADSFCYNYYYGYEGSSFGLAKSLSWEEKYDASLKKMIKVYTVDGESTSQDHYNSELESWGSPSSAEEEYSLTYTNSSDHDKVINTIDGTIDFLMQQCESRDINSAVVTLSGFAFKENDYDNFIYTGKQIKPGATVKIGEKTLTEGTDYTVEYGENKNYGFGTVTIRGMGDYTGHKDVRFKIVPKKVGNLKKSENACDPNNPDKNIGVKHRALEVTWDSQTDVDGYTIDYSDDDSFPEHAEIRVTEDVSTTAYTVEELERKKQLYVRVRAYKTVDGKKFCGEYSDVLSYQICSHLLVTDFWGFANEQRLISETTFQAFYPPAQAKLFAKDKGKNGSTGLCFGLSNLASCILYYDSFNVSPSDFGVDSLYDIKSFDQDPLAKHYICLTHTLEGVESYSDKNDLSLFLSKVEEYTEKGTEPVNFMVARVSFLTGKKKSGHNIVALDIAEKTSSQVKIRVYDCNFPGQDMYIYLYDDSGSGNYDSWKYESGTSELGTLEGDSLNTDKGGVDNDYLRVFNSVNMLPLLLELANDDGSHQNYDLYQHWMMTMLRHPEDKDNSFWRYVLDTFRAEEIESIGTEQDNDEGNAYDSCWVPKTEDETLNIEGVPAGTELNLAGNYHSVTITVSEECDLKIWLPETGEGEVEVTSDQGTDVQVVFQDFDDDGLESKKTFTESVEAGSSVEIVKNVGDSDYAAAGDLNETVSWHLDENGILSVLGKGKIPNSAGSEWQDYRYDIYKIVIENGITSVGDDAFRDCKSCQSVSIPESVDNIGARAFLGCSALEDLDWPKSPILGRIGDEAFLDCDSLVSVVIPEKVRYLGNYAFARCDHLKSVTIPDTVVESGNYLFAENDSLEDVRMGSLMRRNMRVFVGVESGRIEYFPPEGLFSNCPSLKIVTIPEEHKEVGVCEYENCENLQSITLPKTLKEIKDNAFKNCKNLATVIFNGTKEEWKALSFGSGNYYLKRLKVKCSDGYLKLVSALQITLPKTAYPYTGKAITPAVTLKSGSITLKNGTHYTVKYTNNTKVGTATITITGKGAYWGTVKKTFKIYPKGTSIVSLTPGSKQFTVKWNKQATQTTGYQIQCCTDKSFKSNVKMVTVNGTAYTSRKVTVSKAKTTYYVRMRTLKKNASGAMYYSGWSAVKSVKTK